MKIFFAGRILPLFALFALLQSEDSWAHEKLPAACKTQPWTTFEGVKGNRPYRPIVTVQESTRIGRLLKFKRKRLNVDLLLDQPKADDPTVTMIGETAVLGAPVTRMLPGVRTGAYYYEPNGELCRLTREQMSSPEFRKSFGYSGARLQLSQGDLLAMNFRSNSPFRSPDSSNASQPLQAPFGGAPCQSSNLHTHGLLVSPYTYGRLQGDFVLNLSSPTPPAAPDACSSPPTPMHAHGAILGTLKYRIRIPRRPPNPTLALNSGYHPSGLFWLHPHPHGYSASQLSGGTAGLITVGNLSDYADKLPQAGNYNMRFLMLKDAQVDPIAGSSNFRFRANSDPALCQASPKSGYFWTDGFCDDGAQGARWIFTVNGVQNPHIASDVKPGESEIWRIVNASPTVSYRLSIIPAGETTNTPLNPDKSPHLNRKAFKVLAKDGAALPADNGMTSEEKEILLMPGARVEIAIRDLGNQEWSLVSEGLVTGGDVWPHIVLATLKGSDTNPAPVAARAENYTVATTGPSAPLSSSLAATTQIRPLSNRRACDRLDGAERIVLFVKNPNFGDGDNWKNKDLFGVIAGLREPGQTDLKRAVYFERDSSGRRLSQMLQAPFSKIVDLVKSPYDSSSRSNFVPAFGNFPEYGNVCARLSPHQTEEWIIENWTNEIHNFHLHQTRFFVSSRDLKDSRYYQFPCKDSAYPIDDVHKACLPQEVSKDESSVVGYGDHLIEQFYRGHTSMGRESGALTKAAHDSVPIPRGSKDCNGDPSNSSCVPGRISVRIPFNRREQIGEFVYHCHILEHEDRGMMGLVEVVP